MAFEELSAEVSMLVNQMQREPDDHREIYLLLAEKIRELRAFGMSPPSDLLRLEQALSCDLKAHRQAKKPH